MPKKISKEMAQNALKEVNSEQCFWVNNGPVVGSIEKLNEAISKMSKKTFMHHVNNEKNDFATWIKDVIGDEELAKVVSKTKTKPALSGAIKKRVAVLKKAV